MQLFKRELPNGEMITQLNSYETDFVFSEIFVNQTYLKHGIQISNQDIIFDVGANIGLFSLFVNKIAPEAQVYAFEPSALVFEALKANVSGNVKCFNVGIGAEDGNKIFTFYPGYSVISGFHTNIEMDQNVIIEGEKHFTGLSQEAVSGYITERFSSVEQNVCVMRSLNSLIKDLNLTKIDLLKVDAEKSEVEVLMSLDADDWKKIKQVVVEVHGKQEATKLRDIMLSHHFKVTIDEEVLLKDSAVFTLFGVKNGI